MKNAKASPDISENLEIDIVVADPHWDELDLDIAALAEKIVVLTLSQADLPDHIRAHQGLEVSVVLSDDEEVRKLNKRYRHKDKATNVLSFSALEGEEDIFHTASEDLLHLGDIILAYETILKEAEDQEKPVKDHLIHLLIHGILHLLGYDHEQESDATEMENLEIAILSRLGIKNPYTDTNNMA